MVKYINKYNNILYKKYLIFSMIIKSIWCVFLGTGLLYSIIKNLKYKYKLLRIIKKKLKI